MTEREPQLKDFGLTREQYALYKGIDKDAGKTYGFLFALGWVPVAAPVGYFFGQDWALSPFLFSFVAGWIAGPLIESFKRDRLLDSPVASQLEKYEEARKVWWSHHLYEGRKAARERREVKRQQRQAEWARQEVERLRHQKEIDYWMSLSGADFERDMATLCRRLGYSVETTPASGDEGVDLVLRRRGKKIVVQCKSHKSPVGPAVVRELYGSMIASKADKAILACTGGFTSGVRNFAKGKPIELVSASGLVELADGLREPDEGKQHQLE